MNDDLFPSESSAQSAVRTSMNAKPVYEVPAKSVINFESGFAHKLLCDGPTFSTGSACAYSCAFCYVPDLMRKSPHLAVIKNQPPSTGHRPPSLRHEDVVIRRRGAIAALRAQLTKKVGGASVPRFPDPADTRMIYSSPLVDVAANMDLVRETVEACEQILTLTHWQIRLLSKSNLLPKIAEALSPLDSSHKARSRVVYGVSTGTLDDRLALSFEQGTPLPRMRIKSLHWLQDRGFRTFGMICPSLPQADYEIFAREQFAAIRAEKCEHVWAEVINVRGDSMTRTIAALRAGGFPWEAQALREVGHDRAAWEAYARATFLAHAALYSSATPHSAFRVPHSPKLRFLQYVTKDSRPWWEARRDIGAICL